MLSMLRIPQSTRIDLSSWQTAAPGTALVIGRLMAIAVEET